jgi:hypothetical protein
MLQCMVKRERIKVAANILHDDGAHVLSFVPLGISLTVWPFPTCKRGGRNPQFSWSVLCDHEMGTCSSARDPNPLLTWYPFIRKALTESRQRDRERKDLICAEIRTGSGRGRTKRLLNEWSTPQNVLHNIILLNELRVLWGRRLRPISKCHFVTQLQSVRKEIPGRPWSKPGTSCNID